MKTIRMFTAAFMGTFVREYHGFSNKNCRMPAMRSLSTAHNLTPIPFGSDIKVISLDVTGTLLTHKYPIMETYADAAIWAKIPNPPSATELKSAFKSAYKKRSIEDPCFGHFSQGSSREWWAKTVNSALHNCGRTTYTSAEFERYFRRIYQHFGSPEGYELLPDAVSFLDWIGNDCTGSDGQPRFTLGITTNTPIRTIDTVLPMKGLHNHFKWFVCCEEIGAEKPDKKIFDAAFERALFWNPGLKRHQVLHIGDSLAADYCGARSAGFKALYLDRTGNSKVTVYQDWLQCPDYDGKSEEDIRRHTICDFQELKALLS